MNIIKDLERFRLKNRLTQEQLAKKLDVSRLTIERWFSGKFIPNEINQYQIKEFLKNPENKEKIIDQDYIKRHTKNGIFASKAKYGDEAELMTIEYNKSLTPEQRIDAVQYLREQYYLVRGLKHERMNKNIVSVIPLL